MPDLAIEIDKSFSMLPERDLGHLADVHKYAVGRIDHEIVWDVVRNKLPESRDDLTVFPSRFE
jgi:uncharacterized protein with HEPN domain